MQILKKRILILTLDDDDGAPEISRRASVNLRSDRANHYGRTGNAESKRIVLVDDDLQIRNMLQNLLRIKGFEISASLSDGVDLIDTVDAMNPRPDTILLDERMPRMSGVEACRLIHSRYPQIQIIFVSADETAERRAKEAGAAAFLKKPVSMTELLSLLNSN